MNLSQSEIAEFRSGVLGYYRRSARDFPWRKTRDPWLVLTSEIMLQQTRTETVLARWPGWTTAFPTPDSLAEAPLAEVLSRWKGLGYNRRALALRNAAARIVSEFHGAVPEAEADLRSLPGVGPYTARAVRAFAFGRPGIVLETNIRAVYLFSFFPGAQSVTDRALEPYIEATLDRGDPRSWYYALMDYGAALKKLEPNPGRCSASYVRQSRFEGSHRQVRSALLHALAARGSLARPDLRTAVAESIGPYGLSPDLDERLARALAELSTEGFLECEGGSVRLRD